MWVELQQQDADVVQQGLAGVCVPHLGELPQVTQLKTTGLEIRNPQEQKSEVCINLKKGSRKSWSDHDTLTLHPLRKLPMASTVARIHLKV